MDLSIRGKTALVLGGGGGLGRAIATTFAREGAKVALGDIHPEAVESAAEAVRTYDAEALALVLDLADLNSFDRHISSIESTFGPIDILVNIIGGPPPTPAAGQSADLWTKHFHSMVLSVIAITDRVLPGSSSSWISAWRSSTPSITPVRRPWGHPRRQHLRQDILDQHRQPRGAAGLEMHLLTRQDREHPTTNGVAATAAKKG
jgi:3-oxoacyl-[acyl-carrier protein] reductase